MDIMRKIAAVLLCVISIAAVLPPFVSHAEEAADAPVFRLESVTVDNDEHLFLRVHVTDIPERGLSSALVAVQFSRELRYVSCEFNSALRGHKVAGTVDIDRGSHLERRFVWVNMDNSAMYEDFVYVTCEFALPEGLDRDCVYQIGLQLSADPTYYLDSKGNSIAGVTAVGGEVTVRDFDRELSLSVLDSDGGRSDTVYMPVMFSGAESVRGGLASASFTLSWDDRLELLSLVPQVPSGKAQITLNGDASADVSWTCGEDGPMTGGKLEFVTSFRLPEDVAAGDVYEVGVEVANTPESFRSGQDVDLAERVVAQSGVFTVRSVNMENRQKGDVNGDGRINVRDIILIMKIMLGWTAEQDSSLASYDEEMADVNGDSRVNAKDIIEIMKKMLGISKPPVKEPLDTKVNIAGYPESYNEFLSSTVFVGDSICRGLSVYGYLPADNVVAKDGVGAWSIFRSNDFAVRGKDYGVTEALELLRPKNVVLFLGVNDTWGDTNYFVNNYTTLIARVRETLPDAKIYVSSITPVSNECSSYPTNEKIDEFNQALRTLAYNAGCGFVNVSDALKGKDNAIVPEYGASDGLHVQSAAYPVILEQICSQIVG